ncbi:Stress-associated endoplasmic reticulum protein, partial [Arabidopsis thaliana x Arabidopsis arenosa]
QDKFSQTKKKKKTKAQRLRRKEILRFFSGVIMTTSKRLADRKIEKFDKNILKRGFVPETTTKKGKDYPVGPILLGFFVFVVIGSSLFQIIRTATSGGMA